LRAFALIAVVTAAAALVACRPDYPPQSTSDPHYATPAKPDLHYAPPAVQDPHYAPSPAAELSAAPSLPPLAQANGPPIVIIQPMR
jgi:hypothetical protein